MARDGAEQILLEREGVFIHTTIVSQQNEDALVPGKITLSRRREGSFIEWTPVEDRDNESNQGDTEWTVVDTVGYKNDREKPQSASVTMKSRVASAPLHHKYVINFDISELKSFRRSKPNLGWSYLIFILKCGTTYPALHFHQGGTKAFIKQLEKHLVIKKSSKDSCLFLVREHDPQALSKSFDELKLFDEEQADDMLTKFIKDPYTATLGGFSKVTNFLRDTLLLPEPETRPQQDVAEILLECVPGMAINNQDEPGFEMITTQELPPRPEVNRSTPLTPQQWSQNMDNQGQVKDVESLKEAIFRGGVDPSIRIEVWKFLLKYYSWDSSYQIRTEQRKKKVDDYFRMKLQWKSVSDQQEKRNSFIRDRKSLIEKDVTRTDRTHHFFRGEDNANISVLYDILMTYCMYNFDLGYVQGMSDLLAPILVVMENEVDAFWCFAGLMELVYRNFEMDQAEMKTQLVQLHTLVHFTDPKLCNYLESHDSGNMYFCFRWLLIVFKREFSFPDIMRLWEVLWTSKPCEKFHLLICLALLDTEKTTLIENNFGFTEILKHINDLSGQIDLSEVINKAEGIYLQLISCKHLPVAIADILGLETPSETPGKTDGDIASRTRSSPDHIASSTRSSPDHTSLQISTHCAEVSAAEKLLNVNDATETRTTSPDDSSIEILPVDNMDLVL